MSEEMGLPPKSPMLPIRCVAHNHKRHSSSMWTIMEGSTPIHRRSISDSPPLVRTTDVDELEGNNACKIKGQLTMMKDLTGSSSPSDHNTSSEDGSSLKNEIEDKRSPCIINRKLDSNMDPKRLKRILANRLSAQRSRLKKMQYITELERKLNVLQVEIELLTPQVAYYNNQRRLLNVESSVIMQRIAALMHEKVFKDAEFEALRQERERLSQLSHLQEQEQQQKQLTMGFELDQN